MCFWLVFTWWLATVPFLYTCWPFVWFIWRHEGLDGFFIFNWIFFSYWAPGVFININHLSDINIKFAHSSLFLRLHLSLTSFSLQCRKFSAWDNHTCVYLLLYSSWAPIKKSLLFYVNFQVFYPIQNFEFMDFLLCKLNSPLQSRLAFTYSDKKFTVIQISVSL